MLPDDPETARVPKMVNEAMLLPDDEVQNVARRHGEVSIEAVKQTYGGDEIDRLQRSAVEGDGPVTLVADLEPVEQERVEEAAREAGANPSVWLAEATAEVAREGGPTATPTTLTEQVERAILRRTPP